MLKRHSAVDLKHDRRYCTSARRPVFPARQSCIASRHKNIRAGSTPLWTADMMLAPSIIDNRASPDTPSATDMEPLLSISRQRPIFAPSKNGSG
jgi:hypothetical protein